MSNPNLFFPPFEITVSLLPTKSLSSFQLPKPTKKSVKPSNSGFIPRALSITTKIQSKSQSIKKPVQKRTLPQLPQIPSPQTPQSPKRLFSPKGNPFQLLQTLQQISRLPPISQTEINRKKVNLPKRKGYEHKKTVIFDLDQTLIHSVQVGTGHKNVFIKLPGQIQVQASINIRPYVKDLLFEANKGFQVIIFTASHQAYADSVLNLLDPKGKLIHHRLYRDHCIVVNGHYIKDLRILENRKLKDLVIVDNSIFSFAFQLNNGIPVQSWFCDLQDRELFFLIGYLKKLAKVEDVRLMNRAYYSLENFEKENK